MYLNESISFKGIKDRNIALNKMLIRCEKKKGVSHIIMEGALNSIHIQTMNELGILVQEIIEN